MSKELERFFCIVSHTWLKVVVLSTFIEIAGCSWPSSIAVVLMSIAVWQFTNNVAVSHSADDVITSLITLGSIRSSLLCMLSLK